MQCHDDDDNRDLRGDDVRKTNDYDNNDNDLEDDDSNDNDLQDDDNEKDLEDVDDENIFNVGDWVGVRITINNKCRKSGPSHKLFFGKIIEFVSNEDTLKVRYIYKLLCLARR